jgi:hypothetical protein
VARSGSGDDDAEDVVETDQAVGLSRLLQGRGNSDADAVESDMLHHGAGGPDDRLALTAVATSGYTTGVGTSRARSSLR